MPKTRVVTCPECKATEHIYKVSTIYLAGIADEKNHSVEEKAMIAEVFPDLKSLEVHRAVKLFTPPSGSTRIIRPISPDLVVGAFILLAVFFLYNIYFQQPSVFIFAAGITVLFLIFYAIMRKKLVGKYKNQSMETIEEKKIVEKSVDRWMKMYYCVADKVVFDPNRGEAVPLDLAQEYIVRGKI